MSVQSIVRIFNILILMIIINYSSSQVDNRNILFKSIEQRRAGIRYVINILQIIEHDLNTFEMACLSGLPGADCGIELGDSFPLPNRNPGKRSLLWNYKVNEQRNKREDTYSLRFLRSDGGKDPCLSDEPAADCENNGMSEEAKAQDALKKGNRNPGK